MTSLADTPSEARCKQLIYELLTKQKNHPVCGERIAWKYHKDYGWCRICRVKIRPKARTWFRGSNLKYRQIFFLLSAWQSRQSPGSVRNATGLSYTTIQRWYGRFRQYIPPDNGDILSGVVAVDESWFGKKRHGGQTIVIGAIETDTRRLRLQVIPDADQDSIEQFLETWVSRDSHLITDAAMAYHGVEWLGYSRETHNHVRVTLELVTILSVSGAL